MYDELTHLTKSRTRIILQQIGKEHGMPVIGGAPEEQASINRLKGYPAIRNFKVVAKEDNHYFLRHILTDNTGSYLHTFAIGCEDYDLEFYADIAERLRVQNEIAPLLKISRDYLDSTEYTEDVFVVMNIDAYRDKAKRGKFSNKFNLHFCLEVDQLTNDEFKRQELSWRLTFSGYDPRNTIQNTISKYNCGIIKLSD